MKLASLIWTARKKEVFLSSVVLKREELDVFNEMIKGIPYEEIAELHGCSVKKINSIAKVTNKTPPPANNAPFNPSINPVPYPNKFTAIAITLPDITNSSGIIKWSISMNVIIISRDTNNI